MVLRRSGKDISQHRYTIMDFDTTLSFDERFKALTGNGPFCWQRRLFYDCFAKGHIPVALDIPTGLGKTSVMVLWYVAWATGAKVPRRLAYVVDRRAVVDQATTVAEELREKSPDSALRVSTLRATPFRQGHFPAPLHDNGF